MTIVTWRKVYNAVLHLHKQTLTTEELQMMRLSTQPFPHSEKKDKNYVEDIGRIDPAAVYITCGYLCVYTRDVPSPWNQ